MSDVRAASNRVGPILRAGEIANAAVEAVELDNPGKEIHVEDRAAYVRIACDDECILTRASMQEVLGRPFAMREIQVSLSSFAGNIDTSPEQIRFFFDRHL